MSGIYIPGVEKPKSQEQCKFFDYAPFRADYCVLFSTCKGVNACPIIAVPDHGRLIDVDAFVNRLDDCKSRNDSEIRGARRVINQLFFAPTIIQADKEGSE